MTLPKKYQGVRFRRAIPFFPPPTTPEDLDRLLWFDIFDNVDQEDGFFLSWVSKDPNNTVGSLAGSNLGYEDVGFPSGSFPGDTPYISANTSGAIDGMLVGDPTDDFSLFLVFEARVSDWGGSGVLFTYNNEVSVSLSLVGEDLSIIGEVNGTSTTLPVDFNKRYVAHLSYVQATNLVRLAVEAYPTDALQTDVEEGTTYTLPTDETFVLLDAAAGIWFVECLLTRGAVSGKAETDLFTYFRNKYFRYLFIEPL